MSTGTGMAADIIRLLILIIEEKNLAAGLNFIQLTLR